MSYAIAEKRKINPESLRAYLFHNPVADMEYRLLTGEKRGFAWFRYGLLLIGFLLPFIISILDILDGYRNHNTEGYMGVGLMSLGFVVGISTLLTVIRTLTVTSESLSRERKLRTFEQLVLTGMSARQIVLGKWMGNVRHHTDSYIYLFWTRMALAFWVLPLLYLQSMAWDLRSGATLAMVLSGTNFSWLLSVAIISAMLLAIELFFSTALSMIFVNVIHKRTRDMAVIGVRVAIPLVFAFVFGLFTLYLPRFSYPPTITQVTSTYNNRTYTYDSYDWSAYNNYVKSLNPAFWIGYFGFSFDNGALSSLSLLSASNNSRPLTLVADVPYNTQYLQGFLGVMSFFLLQAVMGIGALLWAIRIVEKGQYWKWKAVWAWVLRRKNRHNTTMDIGVFA
jgi:hypothetical protein